MRPHSWLSLINWRYQSNRNYTFRNLNVELFVNIINFWNMCQPWLFIPNVIFFILFSWATILELSFNALNHISLMNIILQHWIECYTWYTLVRLYIHHESLKDRMLSRWLITPFILHFFLEKWRRVQNFHVTRIALK